MDGDRVEGDIDGTRGKTDETALITLEEHQGEDVSGTEDQSNERSHQGATGHITELALGGTLEERSRRHQWADEEKRQPTRDEDVVEDQSH